MPTNPNKLSKFWQELKRRKVTRTITVYAAAAFVILELVSIIVEPLRLPEWTLPFIIVLLCVGFIIAVILSWIYDIHPEGGIVKTEPAQTRKAEEIPKTSNSWKIASYISFVVIVGLIFLNLLPRSNSPKGDPFIGKSIAVLPFADMSLEKDQEYFCDGITEEIINSLTQVKKLKVIARTSSFAFKGKHEDMREIGKKLDVETLVEGSIQKVGDRLRITVQLIKVEDGSHLWSKRFDRPSEDVFAIQDEISQAIVENLRVELLGEKIVFMKNRQTHNIEAFNLYVNGRFFWYQRTKEDLLRGVDYFHQALELDSTYALAFAGLADSYLIMAWYGWYPMDEGYMKGKQYAQKALSINSNLPEAHTTLGAIATFYDLNWEYAEKEFLQALSLNPNYQVAHMFYTDLLGTLARREEAREHIDVAIRLDPQFHLLYVQSAWFYYAAGEYEKVFAELGKAREIKKDLEHGDLILACYIHMNMPNEAVEFIKKQTETDGSVRHHETIDQIYQASGLKGVIYWYNDRRGKIDPKSYASTARLYMLMGDSEKAIEYLEKSFKMRDSWFPSTLMEPDFDSLRDDPRFTAMVSKIGL